VIEQILSRTHFQIGFRVTRMMAFDTVLFEHRRDVLLEIHFSLRGKEAWTARCA
jgi:hypothetical protein